MIDLDVMNAAGPCKDQSCHADERMLWRICFMEFVADFAGTFFSRQLMLQTIQIDRSEILIVHVHEATQRQIWYGMQGSQSSEFN